MVLSKDDILRITALGYHQNFFIRNHNGWLELKNAKGRCVFHSGKECMIYDSRPQGCRFYPVVFHKTDNNILFDTECPHTTYFKLSPSIQEELRFFVQLLEEERLQRKENDLDGN